MTPRGVFSVLDRLIWACVALTVLAGVAPFAAPALVTVAVVVTLCFVAVKLVVYFTTERW